MINNQKNEFGYISKLLLVSAILIFLNSCIPQVGGKASGGNESFEQKFGNQVKGLGEQRLDKQAKEADFKNYRSPDEQKNFKGINSLENSFPYPEITNFGEPSTKIFFPDTETYEQGQQINPANQLSPDIFDISYNTALNPPFKKLGQEFDAIDVPSADIYGISSGSSDKSYLLASHDSIYNSISKIKAQKGVNFQIVDEELNRNIHNQDYLSDRKKENVENEVILSLDNNQFKRPLNRIAIRTKIHSNKSKKVITRRKPKRKIIEVEVPC